jgi:negative regulator of sigma-B (phosphoserine phosphatase)
MDLASPSLPLEWGVAEQAAPRESVTGDAHLMLPTSAGLLLAVIDGSGHGPEAAHATALALNTLRGAPEQSVIAHMRNCHAALAGSRGVVMTLAGYHQQESTLTLCGVGNVEAVLFRARPAAGSSRQESAMLRGGVVGSHLPEPFATVMPVHGGDVLVMASDGLRHDFAPESVLRSPPRQSAGALLRQHARGNDDAVVLVVRFPDPRHE